MSATAADFPTKHCAWSMLERGRIENTHLAKACSYGAIANLVPYKIDLYIVPKKAGRAVFYPLKSVSVASLLHQQCLTAGTSNSPRKISG